MAFNHTQPPASAHVDVPLSVEAFVPSYCSKQVKTTGKAVNSRKRRLPAGPRSAQLFNSGSDIKHIKLQGYISAQYLSSHFLARYNAKNDSTFQELMRYSNAQNSKEMHWFTHLLKCV